MKIKKNGKVINLTESDLKRILKKVLTEDAPFDSMVNVEDLEFKIFVNHKDITGSVSEPKIVGNSEGYFRVDIESDEGVWEPEDIVGVEITGGNLGGERRQWDQSKGKKGSGDSVVYFTQVGTAFTEGRHDGPYFQVILTDTNLEIEEGQQPTLVVRVNLNGRDRDFDEFGQEEKKEKKRKKELSSTLTRNVGKMMSRQ